MKSTATQRAAVAHVRARAIAARDAARRELAAIASRASVDRRAIDDALERIRRDARVTLSFHPDRLRVDGLHVVEGMLADGRYRNQFEVGVTNGSPTAFLGGERDAWEEKLFGGVYQGGGVEPRERPKYGGLDAMLHADGSSPRFGSCFFVLRADAIESATLTWGDSHLGPEHVGVHDVLEPILARLLATVETRGAVLAIEGLDVARALARIASPSAQAENGRALDDYIEAQIHADVELGSDVEGLVIDPSFDGTEIGDRLEELARTFGFSLARHAGFELEAHEVPADFRGPRMAPLAARVASFSSRERRIDAATLGRAANSAVIEAAAWEDWASPKETWQHLKQLWHVLVRYGRPYAR